MAVAAGSLPNFIHMKERWQKLKSTRWFSIATNKFVLATLGFIVWMLFLHQLLPDSS
ncbi:MAG: hypothetical protein U5L96_03915 [Owenweeksia sp.]|nr:hypothetical protein [Owenweeksia sp.]